MNGVHGVYVHVCVYMCGVCVHICVVYVCKCVYMCGVCV